MEPQFITKEEFKVVGFELITSVVDNRNFKEIPEFWDTILERRLLDKIPNAVDDDITLGICMDFQKDGTFSYVIGKEVESTAGIPPDMIVKQIPGAHYAMFSAQGKMPDAIQNTVRYIYEEWLESSGYMRTKAADFELYNRKLDKGDTARVDVYVPVEKK